MAVINEWNKQRKTGFKSGAVIEDNGQSWKVTEWGGKGVYGGGVSFTLDKCDARVGNFLVDLD